MSLRALMPRFDEVMAGSGSLTDAFERLGALGPQLADQPVDPHVIPEPTTVAPDDDCSRPRRLRLPIGSPLA
jgi:hypothetical protein